MRDRLYLKSRGEHDGWIKQVNQAIDFIEENLDWGTGFIEEVAEFAGCPSI